MNDRCFLYEIAGSNNNSISLPFSLRLLKEKFGDEPRGEPRRPTIRRRRRRKERIRRARDKLLVGSFHPSTNLLWLVFVASVCCVGFLTLGKDSGLHRCSARIFQVRRNRRVKSATLPRNVSLPRVAALVFISRYTISSISIEFRG